MIINHHNMVCSILNFIIWGQERNQVGLVGRIIIVKANTSIVWVLRIISPCAVLLAYPGLECVNPFEIM